VPLIYRDVGSSKSGTRLDAICGGVRVAHLEERLEHHIRRGRYLVVDALRLSGAEQSPWWRR
jgi:hypothetical protein